MSVHPWDVIRATPTVLTEIAPTSRGTHESVLRGYQILREVKFMLDRGDSATTIRLFIAWAENS